MRQGQNMTTSKKGKIMSTCLLNDPNCSGSLLGSKRKQCFSMDECVAEVLMLTWWRRADFNSFTMDYPCGDCCSCYGTKYVTDWSENPNKLTCTFCIGYEDLIL